MVAIGYLVLAGLASFSALLVSMYQIYQHLRNYTQPTFQRLILRIIFMIPTYAISSWLSLMDQKNQLWYDTIRDCYEAWVIYNFLALCLAYVGGPGAMVVHMDGCHVQSSWWTMTCCLPDVPIDGQFLRWCKQGALQFVLLKPVLATIALVLHTHGKYSEGEMRPDRGYVWILFVYNMSYSVALLALLLFYLGAKDLLKPFNPLLKFVLVKSVVFLTFWQGMACTFAVQFGWMASAEDGRALQNLLICLEMAAASGLMHFAFPAADYKDPDGLDRGLTDNIEHAISIHDVVSDTVHQFAPSYHDYILYSDGADEGPRRHRTRTFVLMGKEMNPFTRKKKSSDEIALNDKVGTLDSTQREDSLDYEFAQRSSYDQDLDRDFDQDPDRPSTHEQELDRDSVALGTHDHDNDDAEPARSEAATAESRDTSRAVKKSPRGFADADIEIKLRVD